MKWVLSKLIRIAYSFGSERRILFDPVKGWRFVFECEHKRPDYFSTDENP
jgi:hypothetical protein